MKKDVVGTGQSEPTTSFYLIMPLEGTLRNK